MLKSLLLQSRIVNNRGPDFSITLTLILEMEYEYTRIRIWQMLVHEPLLILQFRLLPWTEFLTSVTVSEKAITVVLQLATTISLSQDALLSDATHVLHFSIVRS